MLGSTIGFYREFIHRSRYLLFLSRLTLIHSTFPSTTPIINFKLVSHRRFRIKRGSRGVDHVAISPRWSVKKSLKSLCKTKEITPS